MWPLCLFLCQTAGDTVVGISNYTWRTILKCARTVVFEINERLPRLHGMDLIGYMLARCPSQLCPYLKKHFACLSAITPPVALAAYAGAGIAKTSPMTTAIEACKLGFAGFMVPFAFCYNEAMMMQGNVVDIISVAVSAIVGTAVISAAFQGWLLWKLNILERTAFIVGGLLMFIPGTVTDLIGLAIALLLILINMRKWKKIKQSV